MVEDENLDKTEQEKSRERIQKYKEERRKQMAANRCNIKNSGSSSEDESSTCTAQNKKRTTRPKVLTSSTSTDLDAVLAQTCSSSGNQGESKNVQSKSSDCAFSCDNRKTNDSNKRNNNIDSEVIIEEVRKQSKSTDSKYSESNKGVLHSAIKNSPNLKTKKTVRETKIDTSEPNAVGILKNYGHVKSPKGMMSSKREYKPSTPTDLDSLSGVKKRTSISETKNSTSNVVTKKFSANSESKKLSSDFETRKFVVKSEKKTSTSSTETRKLSRNLETKKSELAPKQWNSSFETKKLSSSSDSKKFVSNPPMKKLANSFETKGSTSNSEPKKLTANFGNKKQISSLDTKAVSNEITTKKSALKPVSKRNNDENSVSKSNSDENPVLKRNNNENPVLKQNNNGNPVLKRNNDGNPVLKRNNDGNAVLKRNKDGNSCFLASKNKEADIEEGKKNKLRDLDNAKSPTFNKLDNLTYEALQLKSQAYCLRKPKENEEVNLIADHEIKSEVKFQSSTFLENSINIAEKAGTRRLTFDEKAIQNSTKISQNDSEGSIYTTESSIMKRKSSREEPKICQGILKKPLSRSNSNEFSDKPEKAPLSILKNKNKSFEDEILVPPNDPTKSILKKKSLTDDELEIEGPRSILKQRSREELTDNDSGSSSSTPVPILKRSMSKDYQSDHDEDIKSILKIKRDSDRSYPVKFESDIRSCGSKTPPSSRKSSRETPISSRKSSRDYQSDPDVTEEPIKSILRNRREPERNNSSESSKNDYETKGFKSSQPLEGILKHRGEYRSSNASQNRNNAEESSRNFFSGEFSVRPKVRSRPPSVERFCDSPIEDGDTRRRTNSLSKNLPRKLNSPDIVNYQNRSSVSVRYSSERTTPVETSPVRCFGSDEQSPSKVLEKAAFFSKYGNSEENRVKEKSIRHDLSFKDDHSPNVREKAALWSGLLSQDQDSTSPRRIKNARFKTQPITVAEVQSASVFNVLDYSVSDDISWDATSKKRRQFKETEKRRRSWNCGDAEETHERVKGILKMDLNRDTAKDSFVLRPILKPDSRKSSFSEGSEGSTSHPKGILKGDNNNLVSSKGSMENCFSTKVLKSAMKRDSNVDENKTIRSILKKQSESLDPDSSLDSESSTKHDDGFIEDSVQAVNHSLIDSLSKKSESLDSPFSSRDRLNNEKDSKNISNIRYKENLAEALRQIEPVDKNRLENNDKMLKNNEGENNTKNIIIDRDVNVKNSANSDVRNNKKFHANNSGNDIRIGHDVNVNVSKNGENNVNNTIIFKDTIVNNTSNSTNNTTLKNNTADKNHRSFLENNESPLNEAHYRVTSSALKKENIAFNLATKYDILDNRNLKSFKSPDKSDLYNLNKFRNIENTYKNLNSDKLNVETIHAKNEDKNYQQKSGLNNFSSPTQNLNDLSTSKNKCNVQKTDSSCSKNDPNLPKTKFCFQKTEFSSAKSQKTEFSSSKSNIERVKENFEETSHAEIMSSENSILKKLDYNAHKSENRSMVNNLNSSDLPLSSKNPNNQETSSLVGPNICTNFVNNIDIMNETSDDDSVQNFSNTPLKCRKVDVAEHASKSDSKFQSVKDVSSVNSSSQSLHETSTRLVANELVETDRKIIKNESKAWCFSKTPQLLISEAQAGNKNIESSSSENSCSSSDESCDKHPANNASTTANSKKSTIERGYTKTRAKDSLKSEEETYSKYTFGNLKSAKERRSNGSDYNSVKESDTKYTSESYRKFTSKHETEKLAGIKNNFSEFENINKKEEDLEAILRTSTETEKVKLRNKLKENCHSDQASSIQTSASGTSINQRLATLQKNFEEGWKSRVQKSATENFLPVKNEEGSKSRPLSNLIDRLDTSQEQWKKRVPEKDSEQFTVLGKMTKSLAPSVLDDKGLSGLRPSSPIPIGLASPNLGRKMKMPTPKIYKSKTGGCLPEILNKGTPGPTEEKVKLKLPEITFSRSISVPNDDGHSRVAIPKLADDAFESFFAASEHDARKSDSIKISSDDFDHVTSSASHLIVKRRRVVASRKNRGSHNPVRSLALRDDILDEYTNVVLGIGEQELKMKKIEELAKSSSLAMEALAGLASKENFSAVALRKTESSHAIFKELSPFLNATMLIMVKGRRRPQVRLVEPIVESVNQGDDFILITYDELFHYKGEFANVLEGAVATDMVSYITQTKDMGVNQQSIKVTEVDENSTISVKNRFWSQLGGNSESFGRPVEATDYDDGLVETALLATNKTYRVDRDSLVPLDSAWGQCPKYQLLEDDQVLVFDFGAELYLWCGKRADSQTKKIGTDLLKEMWQEDYDYSDCDINPVFPSRLVDPLCAKDKRPSWGICGKITENVETILFKEKFVDWPDTQQQARNKQISTEPEMQLAISSNSLELEICDVATMIENRCDAPDLVLEMTHLGRGIEYYDEEERRLHTISTNEIKVWKISENEQTEICGPSISHFYSDETYVVRWYYQVTASGRTLKGAPSKHNVTGRSRVAYFFWQGKTSSISDKGACALLTVELDAERGPHVRVDMGFEPPAFLNIFGGSFVIFNGRRTHSTNFDSQCKDLKENENKTSTKLNETKLFIVRGEMVNEAHLIEVPLSTSHFRSRACLIFCHLVSSTVFLWIGSKASEVAKKVANRTTSHVMQNKLSGLNWKNPSKISLKEETESLETSEFLSILNISGGVKLSQDYFYLYKDSSNFNWNVRFWRCETKSNRLECTEVTSTYNDLDVVSAFPMLQEELYSASQPALYIIDTGRKVYVWQGWIPDSTDITDLGLLGCPDQPLGTSTAIFGSAEIRFTYARRAALRTAISYCRKKHEMIRRTKFNEEKYSESDLNCLLNPRLVISGLESLEFQNVFPIWNHNEQVARINLKENRWNSGEEYCVQTTLDRLSRDEYPLESLKNRPLPDGVDSSRLEQYLSNDEFKVSFGCSKEEFITMPAWKQIQLKKTTELF